MYQFKSGQFALKHVLFLLIFVLISTALPVSRTEINIPDIPEYTTLKCDLHMHTVFSDGNVWPTIRVAEAWRDGLDAISITDHIEYLPHTDDIPKNLNRPYEIALPHAEAMDLLFPMGAEITRERPTGHINAIFLNDINPLDTEVVNDAIKAAVDQGAFVFMNHPGWRQPNNIGIWYDEHTVLLENGWLHGVEVVNGSDYYPEAHQWCLDKKLTMMANSDVHNPIDYEYNQSTGKHRPVTLVFVKEKSLKGIKEALFGRRTAVFKENLLIGEKQFIEPIFYQSVKIKNPQITIKGTNSVNIQIHNDSDISYELVSDTTLTDIFYPSTITLQANKTVVLTVGGKIKDINATKEIALPYVAKNLLIEPAKGLPVKLKLHVNFIPASE
ncbi:histidinol-phosphatase [candidate division KSB1 bacterium]|nr:histidinol-phosphatase [candidate division KSB1 bacterium]